MQSIMPQFTSLTAFTPHRLPICTPHTFTYARLPARLASITITAAHRYQGPLTNPDRKAKRAEAQRLGKALVTVHLGHRGVTPSFLQGFSDALTRNQLVKVRVPGGDVDVEEDELINAISEGCDCILIHKIGFTFTFYRQKGLPPVTKQAILSAALSGVDSDDEGVDGGDSKLILDDKAQRRKARKDAQKEANDEKKRTSPPEFEIIQ